MSIAVLVISEYDISGRIDKIWVVSVVDRTGFYRAGMLCTHVIEPGRWG
jgi:hypothetical protein